MKEKELENMFDDLRGSLDYAEPADGHRERFLQKLNKENGTIAINTRSTKWYRSLAVAASLAIICVLGIFLLKPDQSVATQVAHIAPEASQTRLYFSSLIEEQVKLLQAANTPATTTMIADTMSQLKSLEEAYGRLEEDLINGGDSNLIMQAMIINFQTRIELLQEVLNTINSINDINNNNDENFTI